ncbi:uncharacterized protein LOC108458093 isoform X4 [Gossypium arboreum]|uniref:uncharacterized protein LOC108458093 isoform X4 n=1 Tax=Gossypium arboreum TaxID=29729 RepID=UPI0022F18BD7|nr:uncharacterized protein LOC108458093 isoform X4 [Gossypium arboreum]
MSFCSTQFYPSHIPEIAHFFPLKNFPKNLKFPQIANFFSKSKSQPNCRSQSVELLDPTEGICRKPSAVDIIYNISLQIVHSAIQRELPVVIAKARKLITLSKFRIHIQRTRNITATHWDRVVRIQNQATHKSYIWSLDCHCNQ